MPFPRMWRCKANTALHRQCEGAKPRCSALRPPAHRLLPSRPFVARAQYSTVVHARRNVVTTVRPSRTAVSPEYRATRRGLFTDSLPTVLVPPTIFLGLLLGLWTYKCLMTVVFQDKIIYLPYLPPFARYEKVDDYAAVCRPVQWEQQTIVSLDGTKLAICVGSIAGGSIKSASRVNDSHTSASGRPSTTMDRPLHRKKRNVVICYFQGNGGSTPPRLPLLSNVLKHLQAEKASVHLDIEFTIIALSYRGFWKSSGRASQTGIEQDAQALLHHVVTQYGGGTDGDLHVILWGQSIGAGVALAATSTFLSRAIAPSDRRTGDADATMPLLILETPFTSIKAMLLTLYPQTWLPYQYLWPFLWNHWNSEMGLRKLATVDPKVRPEVLLIGATRDEVVPAGEADRLEEVSREVGLVTHRRDVIGALHTDATIRIEGRKIVCDGIMAAIKD